MSLRCRVHIELALCEESVEQIEAALKHLNKALVLDEDGELICPSLAVRRSREIAGFSFLHLAALLQSVLFHLQSVAFFSISGAVFPA